MKNRFQSKVNIRKGDQVVVITGNDKDRGTARKVLAVYPQSNRVLVEGVNVRTKHQKPDARNPQGGIVEQEAPIHISNVMLWDAKSKGPSRITRERKDDGSFARVSKKSGEEIK